MTNVEHCFKIRKAAQFSYTNLKIKYAHEKYGEHLSDKNKKGKKDLGKKSELN